MPTRPSLRIALWLPNTRRRLAPFLLAALLPGLTGCGFSIARDVAYGGCIGLLWGFGVLPSGDKAADAKAAKQCVQSFFGKKLVTGEAGSTPPIGAAAAVTRTGEALLAAYGADFVAIVRAHGASVGEAEAISSAN